MGGWSAGNKSGAGATRRCGPAVMLPGDGLTAVPVLFPGWRIDLVQLGRGQLHASGMHLPVDDLHITQLRLDRKSVLRAATPRDQGALVVSVPPSPPLAVGSRRVEGEQCLAIGPNARVEIILPDRAAVVVVHLRTERRGQHQGCAPLPLAGQLEYRRLQPERIALLASFSRKMAALCGADVAAAEVLQLQAELGAMARQSLGKLFVLAAPLPPEADDRTLRRQAVARACAYIDAQLRKPLALSDLCTAAGVGMRTLEYGFREIYDVGPMAYLRSMRLARVHGDLCEPRNADESVTEAARRWCFTHMGQFSKDYRLQFGESPSVTLKRSRKKFEWGCGETAWGEGGRA